MKRFLPLLLTLALATAAHTQEMPISRIEAIGQSTAYASPTHAEFWFHFQARDANIELAMKAVQEFEPKLHAAVNEAELRPQSFEISAPAVPDVRESRAIVSAVLRFSMAAFANPDNGPLQFAQLCDKLSEIANTLECEVVGPTLDNTERSALQQAALTAATESAYPAGDAIAKTLNSAIWAVETVQVLELVWNDPLEFQGVEPTLRQMSCTAKVRVTYALRTP